jgi:Helix-turn-helix domain
MSFQATDAVRDHSKSRGATRTVAFVLATYADKFGKGVYPSIATIAKQAKVTRKTAVDARRWLIDSGEVEVEKWRATRTKSPSPEISFAPLIAKGSPSEPFDSEGCDEPTLKGSPSDHQGFAEDPSKGSPSEPEPSSKPLPKPEDEAAAAAAASSSEDDVLEQLVNRVYSMWKSEVFPDENKPLTDARRRAISARLGHYEPEEIEQAIRNRESSDWFSGRKPQDRKQRFDLTDLLASDETLEELRDAQPVQRGGDKQDFIGRMKARRGLTDPALAKICARPVDEDEERREKYAKYDAMVEEAVVVPTLTPAQLRAEHQEQAQNLRAVEDRLATKPTDYLRGVAAEAKAELAKLEREHPDVFGEVAA